jgi:hypothetical protein
MDDPGIESRWGLDFQDPAGLTLEPTKPPVRLFPGALSPGKSDRSVALTTQPHLGPRL